MIIIVGCTHHNTLSMIRSFGIAGENVDVILHDGNANSYVLKSKYINNSHVADSEEYALVILKQKYENAIVIACSDGFASLMDLHYEKLKDKFIFFNCGKQGLLTKYMDKDIQTKIAEESGFDIPMTMVHIVGEPVPNIPIFPCILKPQESIHGGKHFVVCQNETDIKQALNDFEMGTKVLIQEYVKKDYEIVVDGVRVNGKVIIPGYVYKHRESAGGTTYSTIYSVEKLDKSIYNATVRLATAMDYTGIFGVEVMVTEDKNYFVEINLRNDATTYAFTVAGCNIPYIYLRSVTGGIIEGLINPIREINSMVEMRDIRCVFMGKLNPIKWYFQFLFCDCLYFKVLDDIRPYYCARKELLKTIMNKLSFLRK